VPAEFVALIQINGGPVGYTINMGHNIFNQRGEEAANLYDAVYKFSLERCAMGLGDQPYNPFPANAGPPPAPNNEGAGVQQQPEPQEGVPQAGQGPNAEAGIPPAVPVPPFVAPDFGDLEELFFDILNEAAPANQDGDVIVLD
jgi:hypothetical protein